MHPTDQNDESAQKDMSLKSWSRQMEPFQQLLSRISRLPLLFEELGKYGVGRSAQLGMLFEELLGCSYLDLSLVFPAEDASAASEIWRFDEETQSFQRSPHSFSLALYEQFLETLPRAKRGDPEEEVFVESLFGAECEGLVGVPLWWGGQRRAVLHLAVERGRVLNAFEPEFLRIVGQVLWMGLSLESSSEQLRDSHQAQSELELLLLELQDRSRELVTRSKQGIGQLKDEVELAEQKLSESLEALKGANEEREELREALRLSQARADGLEERCLSLEARLSETNTHAKALEEGEALLVEPSVDGPAAREFRSTEPGDRSTGGHSLEQLAPVDPSTLIGLDEAFKEAEMDLTEGAGLSGLNETMDFDEEDLDLAVEIDELDSVEVIASVAAVGEEEVASVGMPEGDGLSGGEEYEDSSDSLELDDEHILEIRNIEGSSAGLDAVDSGVEFEGIGVDSEDAMELTSGSWSEVPDSGQAVEHEGVPPELPTARLQQSPVEFVYSSDSLDDLDVEVQAQDYDDMQSLVYHRDRSLSLSSTFVEFLQTLRFELKLASNMRQIQTEIEQGDASGLLLMSLEKNLQHDEIEAALQERKDGKRVPLIRLRNMPERDGLAVLSWGNYRSKEVGEEFWYAWLQRVRSLQAGNKVLSIGVEADEPEVQALLRFCCGEDCELQACADPAEGIQYLYQAPPHLLLLKIGEYQAPWSFLFSELSRSARTQEVPLLLLSQHELGEDLLRSLKPLNFLLLSDVKG